MPLAQARRSSRAYRPQKNAATGHATATTTARRSVCGALAPETRPISTPLIRPVTTSADEEQPAQVLEALTRGLGAGREQLEVDALSVNGHQAASPAWLTRIGIPTCICLFPEIVSTNRSR